jgi:hypothetical protein
MFGSKTDSLAYFHCTLELDSNRRYMGTINHLQVTELVQRKTASEGPTHSVRFWDGSCHRSLEGKATVGEDGVRLLLDMGKAKRYHFRKLGTPESHSHPHEVPA